MRRRSKDLHDLVTEERIDALDSFVQTLDDRSREEVLDWSVPDYRSLLRRILQGCVISGASEKHLQRDAVEVVKEGVQFRIENGMRDIMRDDFFPAGFEEEFRSALHFSVGGHAKDGRPFIVFDFTSAKVDRLSALWHRGSNQKKHANFNILWFCRLMTYLQRDRFPKLKAAGTMARSAEEHCVLLLNCKGIGFGHMTNMFTVRFLTGINHAGCLLYPMFMDKFYCTCVPGLAKALFSCVKPLLHPSVAAKNVLLTEKEVPACMASLADADNLPELVGGRIPISGLNADGRATRLESEAPSSGMKCKTASSPSAAASTAAGETVSQCSDSSVPAQEDIDFLELSEDVSVTLPFARRTLRLTDCDQAMVDGSGARVVCWS